MSGPGGMGGMLALNDETLRIHDLREREEDLRNRLDEPPVPASLKDFGTPFMSSTFAAVLVIALATFAGMLLMTQLMSSKIHGDVALADREFLKHNCTTCLTQPGSPGAKGASGTAGPSGATGPSGPPGSDGPIGPKGNDAMCVPNPMYPCAMGPTGETGPPGQKGETGAGIQGVSGATGPSGPTGATGAKGNVGDKGNDGQKGDTGGSGPQGPPFSGVANFTGVNILGPTLCAVPIDQSCLGPGGCFNFTLCTIVMEGGRVQGVTQAPVFIVGGSGSPFAASFQLGQTGSNGHTAYFGKRFGSNPTAYKVAIFQTYASSVIMEASNFFTLRSEFNLDVISETGTITVRAQGGAIDVSATTNITFAQSGLANTISFNAAGSWQAIASYHAIVGDNIVMNAGSGSTSWYRTNTGKSLVCATGGLPPAADLTRRSQSFGTDLILEPYPSNQAIVSAKIISNSSDGYVNVGPNLKVCGNTIRTAGTTLILQGNGNDTISLSAGTVTNSALGLPLTFSDAEGVDFRNTVIMNSGSAVIMGDCGQHGAVVIDDDLVVTGILYSAGAISCPSDRRSKQNIVDANPETAYERITHLPIKAFEYTKEFIERGGHGGAKLNTTYYGVIAQEVKHDFEYLVHVARRDVIPDFHFIRPELLYGEMIGALQHMDKLHRVLASRVVELENMLKASRVGRI